jgi:hypothetical protein
VYEFTYNGNGNWTQTSIITDSSIAATDRFGVSVDIDGNTAVVGAPYRYNTGVAFVIERSNEGSPWTTVAELKSSNSGRGEGFGELSAISGKRVIVGAPMHNDGLTKMYSGAFAIFEELSGSWKETLYSVPSPAVEYSMCGSTVAIQGDFAFVACGTDSKETKANSYAGKFLLLSTMLRLSDLDLSVA